MYFFAVILNNLSVVVFIVGLWGLVVIKGNLLLILISVEVIIFSVSNRLLLISAILDDILGQLFTLFLLAIAASESAIGLALLVVYYKLRGNLRHIFVSTLKA